MRLVRHDSALGRWEMAFAEPDARLAGLVLGYCGYDERTPGPMRRREVASGALPLIVGFGTPIAVAEARGAPATAPTVARSFVAGLYDGPVVVQHGGEMRGVQVDLSPLGARLLLGMPLAEIANRTVPLDDLGALAAALGHDLPGRLEAAPDWTARFDLLDALLVARVTRGPAPSRAATLAARAWRRLERTAGAVAVAALAEELGVSRKHLTLTFREQIGLAPKPAARILRFSRVMDRLRDGDVASWSALAHECGYADQSHLVRDFRELAGCPPTALEGLRLPDDGGWAAEWRW
jgi:AraC-like DNA-binding protein